MPINYFELNEEISLNFPLNILIIGNLNNLKNIKNNKNFLTSRIFTEYSLNLLESLTNYLNPNNEKGSSIETFLNNNNENNNTLQRVVLCAIPKGYFSFSSFFLLYFILLYSHFIFFISPFTSNLLFFSFFLYLLHFLIHSLSLNIPIKFT